MKKVFFLLALSTLCLFSQAQLRYGVSGGINLSYVNLDGSLLENSESISRFGFTIGLGAEYCLPGNFILLADINLISKNYAFDVGDFYGTGTEGFDRYNILYINMPIRVAYQIRKIRVFTGPFIDFCVGGSNKHSLEYINGTSTKSSKNVNTQINTTSEKSKKSIFPLEDHYFMDAGICIGAGHKSENYAIDLSYSLGMMNMFPNNYGEVQRTNYHLKSSVVSLNFFFFLK